MKIHEDVFEQLTETEISEGSKRILRNLLTKDLVLAYFKEEEIHEMKWKLEIIKELYVNMHPAEGCLVTGYDRAYVNDKEHDVLEPLSTEQVLIIETMFTSLASRLTRAREMKQQEMMNTQINEQRADLGGDSADGGGILGRFG